MLSARDDKEQFIFDDNFGYKFKLDENLTFKINGNVSIGKKTKKDPFSNYPLKQNDCTITIGKNIEFYIAEDINIDNIDYYWKVKNRGKDLINKNGERECRGEITFNQTYNNPESTAYNGIHYVECYVISNRKCIAYDRVYVRIKK